MKSANSVYLKDDREVRQPMWQTSIIGSGPKFQHAVDLTNAVAPSDVSVLLLGESGTGKEKFAEAIHLKSPRANKPFVRINCASLPPTLIESELFGHEKGVFTGAYERKTGKFERAQQGTIFLDEIGELPLMMQSKLLHVLQEKQIERIGGNASIPIDTRVIAATNRNLEKDVAEGTFRKDLFYRLNIFPITLPPLRDRKEDIRQLADYFLSMYNARFRKNIKGIAPEALMQLENHHWPGNIREMQHLFERAVLLCPTHTIHRFIEFDVADEAEKVAETKVKSLTEMERDHIVATLRRCKGKISGKDGAAELLDINPSTLVSRLKKLGISQVSVWKNDPISANDSYY
ncbi:MAG: sigma-54 interaction domain-containing protein [Dyadobacter fermentans]